MWNRLYFKHHTWNAMKTYLSPYKNELKQNVDTKLKTANSQLLRSKSIVKLTLLPFTDNHEIIISAIAVRKYIIIGLLFLQNPCEATDIEHSCLISKHNIQNTTPSSKQRFYNTKLLKTTKILPKKFQFDI